MTPTGNETGFQSDELRFQLKLFTKGQGCGKSSIVAQFCAPGWICSESGCITCGACLGWLLIPQDKAVELWSACWEMQCLQQIDWLEAEPECPGLQLQLDELQIQPTALRSLQPH